MCRILYWIHWIRSPGNVTSLSDIRCCLAGHKPDHQDKFKNKIAMWAKFPYFFFLSGCCLWSWYHSSFCSFFVIWLLQKLLLPWSFPLKQKCEVIISLSPQPQQPHTNQQPGKISTKHQAWRHSKYILRGKRISLKRKLSTISEQQFCQEGFESHSVSACVKRHRLVATRGLGRCTRRKCALEGS